ncbi:MAG TPA: low specificity L-threonine aldolase [Ktedonobacter sp.]|nr:low specificity L-threonine aldolase [Ktedonobacter sp.]
MDEQEKQQIIKSCTRFLRYHYPQTPHQVLSTLAETTDAELEADHYGQGKLISSFENEIADMLGKEAAVFMPSGTMCQQIALRIWSERNRLPRVAFHPTCHLEIHEQFGYQRLHHLESVLVGTTDRMFILDDLKKVSEPISALLIELPQREIGGQLPTWDELNAMIEWAREKGIATHMDGARLWECQPFYNRSYAEIASLFDSVYVSFYKILNGIAGAILAGPADFIAEARVWQRRHGGNLVHLYPYVLSAKQGMATHLERMGEYHEKAKSVASVLSEFSRISVVPNPPQTNMMHVFLQGDPERLIEASLDVARETKTLLFSGLTPTLLLGYSKFELSVGDATLDLSNEEIRELFERIFDVS